MADPILIPPGATVIEMTEVQVSAADNPEQIILQDVNWTIHSGDYWVVASLSGAGKNELLSVAAGVQRPDQGIIRLFNRDAAQLSEDDYLVERLRIGMVFGGGGRLFHHLSVRDNIALALCYHRNRWPETVSAEADAVAETLGLAPFLSQSPRQLSQSWRQRVALARALVMRPEILLLANFITSLEPKQTEWWKQFLAGLSTGHPYYEGKPVTLVVATHDLDSWRNEAKQCALVKEKRLTVLGSRAEWVLGDDPLLGELQAAPD